MIKFKRIFCLFGKHKSESVDLASDGLNIWNKKLIFCSRCRKILYIGYFPPEHPNCLCQIIPSREQP